MTTGAVAKIDPKVSVIIPHFNMHAYLPDAVKSVAGQDYGNIELIIVDDGSDERVDTKNLSRNSIDLTIIEIAHGGKSRAVNKGFEHVTGDLITILDADDQLPKNSISKRVSMLEADQAELCIGSFEVRYQEKTQSLRSISNYPGQTKEYLKRHLLTTIISPFHQNGMLFSKKLLQRTGPMDSQMIRGQDKDYAIRLIQNSETLTYVDEPVYWYNRYDRPIQKRIGNRLMGAKYKLKVISRYTTGWRRPAYLGWGIAVEGAKLVHDLFGIYKK